MRRLSLVLACLAVILVCSAQVKVRLRVIPTTVVPSGLITTSDITYNGSSNVCEVGGTTTNFSFAHGPLTGRHIGGEVHLFIMSGIGASGAEEMIECKWNGLGASNPMTFVKNWGDPTQGRMAQAMIVNTYSAGNSNLLSTSGAGSATLVSAGTPFTTWTAGVAITAGTNFVPGNYVVASYTDSSHITLQSSPTPSGAGSAGTGFGAYGCGSVLRVQGLLWDDTLNAVFWTWSCTYDSGEVSVSSIGYTILNDGAGTSQAYGPWRTTTNSKKTEGYMIPLPAAVQSALGGGMRFGVGAPTSSQNSQSAWGSFLTAWAPPLTTTPPNDLHDLTTHAISDTNLIYSDYTYAQIKTGDTVTCGWTHYGEHDVLVTLSSGNSNLLSTSGAGSTTVVAASAAFSPAMVGNNLYIDGSANSKFCPAKYLITGYTDSTHITTSTSPTPVTLDPLQCSGLSGAGGAGVGGFGTVGAEPQENPTQNGTGCNVNGALCGVISTPDPIPGAFGGGSPLSRQGLDNPMSMASIDGPSKKGIIYFDQVLQTVNGVNYGPSDPNHAHSWYGPTQVYPTGKFCPHGHNGAWTGPSTGNASDLMGNFLYVYDPADVLAVIAGSKLARDLTQNYAYIDGYPMGSIAHGSSIQLNGITHTNDLGVSFPAFSGSTGSDMPSRGAWWDATDGKLYLVEINKYQSGCCYLGPVVHQFTIVH
jgi:hypothetical protein